MKKKKDQAPATDRLNITESEFHTYRRRLGFFRFLLAISILGLVLCAGISIYYYTRYDHTQAHLKKSTEEIRHLEFELTGLRNTSQQQENILAVIRHPETRVVRMDPLPVAPPGTHAIVIWNPSTQETFISPQSLPVSEVGKHYQLWAVVNDQPADAGLFLVSGTERNIFRMKDVKQADMFAVTLEKEGGSSQPTLEQMYVAGRLLNN